MATRLFYFFKTYSPYFKRMMLAIIFSCSVLKYFKKFGKNRLSKLNI